METNDLKIVFAAPPPMPLQPEYSFCVPASFMHKCCYHRTNISSIAVLQAIFQDRFSMYLLLAVFVIYNSNIRACVAHHYQYNLCMKHGGGLNLK